MRILGIDPGIATIGFGVVDSEKNKQKLIQCGVITTPAHTSLASRLKQKRTQDTAAVLEKDAGIAARL